MLDGDHWVITGQKVWTSLATVADWCFLLARTEPGSQAVGRAVVLLVPMDQEALRPAHPAADGTAEFNEVFFDGARTPSDWWSARSAMAGASRWRTLASSAASRRSDSKSATARLDA